MIKRESLEKFSEVDLDLMPDIESFKADLTQLDEINFQGFSEREIYDKIYDFGRIMPSHHLMMSKENFNKFTFFRARLNIDRKKEDTSLIQTYSCPPSGVCKSNGRANLKYKSVFYCSNEPHAAIVESKPEVGSEGYLSFWKADAKRSIKMGNCLPYELPAVNEWSEFASYMFDEMQTGLKLMNARDKIKHFVMMNRFIAQKFKEEKEPYYISSTISDIFLFDGLWHDFLIYPSVMADLKCCNMVFHPNSVNENLKFNKVVKFKVKKIDGELMHLKFGKVGYIENTKMKWRKISKEETKYFNQID